MSDINLAIYKRYDVSKEKTKPLFWIMYVLVIAGTLSWIPTIVYEFYSFPVKTLGYPKWLSVVQTSVFTPALLFLTLRYFRGVRKYLDRFINGESELRRGMLRFHKANYNECCPICGYKTNINLVRVGDRADEDENNQMKIGNTSVMLKIDCEACELDITTVAKSPDLEKTQEFGLYEILKAIGEGKF